MSLTFMLMSRCVLRRWSDKWEGPDEPYAWMRALMGRLAAVNELVRRAQAGRLLAEPVAIGDIFHPDVFLNALRQQTARTSTSP